MDTTYEDDFEEEDDEEVEEKNKREARSVPNNGSYIRKAGKCRRHYCDKPAAPHQVYCSRDCSPFGNLQGDGPLSDAKQVYKARKKKKKLCIKKDGA